MSFNQHQSGPPKYIRYVPAQDGSKPKIIRMVEVQKDPMEPAKFKINQKIPGPPPSPPAPIMHSPPRKPTADEQSQWKIPPCVSSWKNPRGYTVPLDKRCAFNGRNGAQPETINPKFAQLSESLYISTRQHREALEERIKAEKLMAQKEKEKNEEKLRLLAKQAREERSAVQRGYCRDINDSEDEDINDQDVEERMRLREERHRERVRNANIKSSVPGKRTKLDRERERDISEQIALGMARPNTIDKDIHDQRLYNQSAQGIGSGFGEDDEYTVYDKAWKSKESFSANYRPSESIMQEAREEQEADREAPSSSKHNYVKEDVLEPIQFESSEKDDIEDIFNVESFLKNAKYNAKKQQQQQQSTRDSQQTKKHRSS